MALLAPLSSCLGGAATMAAQAPTLTQQQIKEPRVPIFKLPLSGDVVQSINPFTAFMTGGQFGLVNINLGQSSEPKIEEDVLSDVASYGKQLGRIGDGLIVLLNHFHPRAPLSSDEMAAIDALKEMLEKIAKVKEGHRRPALHPSAGAPIP